MPQDHDKITAEVERRIAEQKGQYVLDQRKERQRALISSTVGAFVHDIVQFPDLNGDDIVVFVYSKHKGRELEEGQKAVVQIILSEPDRQMVVFDEVTHRNGRYLLADGRILVLELQRGSYNY